VAPQFDPCSALMTEGQNLRRAPGRNSPALVPPTPTVHTYRRRRGEAGTCGGLDESGLVSVPSPPEAGHTRFAAHCAGGCLCGTLRVRRSLDAGAIARGLSVGDNTRARIVAAGVGRRRQRDRSDGRGGIRGGHVVGRFRIGRRRRSRLAGVRDGLRQHQQDIHGCGGPAPGGSRPCRHRRPCVRLRRSPVRCQGCDRSTAPEHAQRISRGPLGGHRAGGRRGPHPVLEAPGTRSPSSTATAVASGSGAVLRRTTI
jgi:hypothetical protein